ncbi:hypothetical protein QAD02_022030 [Eretmocerus hayati]|uniref:Uncharacterized protein n=1 Tax=Eretmocerus hayati TaxID=131215 RepID=A0ACC2PTH4_9HYME|nr:hypothetical protein QAD02_022030 [Eretmocerus hayati]
MSHLRVKSVKKINVDIKKFHRVPVNPNPRKVIRDIYQDTSENFRPSKMRKYSAWEVESLERAGGRCSTDTNPDGSDTFRETFSRESNSISIMEVMTQANASKSSTQFTAEDNEVEIVGEIIRKPKYRPLRLLAALGYIEETEQRITSSEEQLHSFKKKMKLNRPEHGKALLWGHRLTWVPKPLPPPAPGVITGVKPWEPLLVPRTAEGVQAMIALKRGDCEVSSFDENSTLIVEAAGIINVSPGKSSWKCASCYVDTYNDIKLRRGLPAHRIHVLGLQSSPSPMMCVCGKSAYEIKRLTSCSACIDTCMRHIVDIKEGMIFGAEFARIDPRASNWKW